MAVMVEVGEDGRGMNGFVVGGGGCGGGGHGGW